MILILPADFVSIQLEIGDINVCSAVGQQTESISLMATAGSVIRL